MHEAAEYDAFAEIYDVWVGTGPSTNQIVSFYVEEFRNTEGPAVELGVGSGRIAVAAAQKGKPMIGIDNSAEMLKLCLERAEAAGVAHLVTLVQADMRTFTLSTPAELIGIPFHTIGHLVSMEDKRASLRQIYSQLKPSGRLIFDHFVFDPAAARQQHGVARLQTEYTDATTGHDVLLWVMGRHSLETQSVRIITWTEELDRDGVVLQRKYRRLNFSWLDPRQARALLTETGFEIEACYGEFDRRPFSPNSPEQIWVARRPAAG